MEKNISKSQIFTDLISEIDKKIEKSPFINPNAVLSLIGSNENSKYTQNFENISKLLNYKSKLNKNKICLTDNSNIVGLGSLIEVEGGFNGKTNYFIVPIGYKSIEFLSQNKKIISLPKNLDLASKLIKTFYKIHNFYEDEKSCLIYRINSVK